jgi:hypothetical protein
MGRPKSGGIPLPEDADVCCIACGEPLYFLPDSYPLVFHCEGGHFLTVRDLLDESLPLAKKPRRPALECWRRKSLLFEDLAGQALLGGHALVAADLQETAGLIDMWAASLIKLLGPDAPSASPAEAFPQTSDST